MGFSHSFGAFQVTAVSNPQRPDTTDMPGPGQQDTSAVSDAFWSLLARPHFCKAA